MNADEARVPESALIGVNRRPFSFRPARALDSFPGSIVIRGARNTIGKSTAVAELCQTISEPENQMAEMVDRDQEHLRLLKIGYYVLAGMTLFFSLFGLLYAGLGGLLFSGVFPKAADPKNDPRFVGLMFLGLGLVFFVLGLAMATLFFVTGRSLGNHRRRTFCLVIAGVSCLYIPWGTAMGVCTILVLIRPEVKNMFEPQAPTTLPQ
jgi:hypothetical protein